MLSVYKKAKIFILTAMVLAIITANFSCASSAEPITVPYSDISSWPVKISYLNLDRSTERKDLMEAQLNAAKLSYERLVAVEGKNQVQAELRRKGLLEAEHKFERPLSAGEIGVFLSNLKYFDLVESGTHEQIHILFEDDVIIPVDLEAEIKTALKTVPDDWGLLYFGCYLDNQYSPKRGALVVSPFLREEGLAPICPLRKMNPVEGTPWVKLTNSCTAGGYAYAVRKKAVENLRKFILPMRHPVDDSLRRGYSEFKAYCLNPNLIRTRYSTESTIR